MATTLPTGIVVPDGSDPMNTLVQLLRDMGLTGNRIPSVSSQSEAQAIVDALASTPYPATADNPVYVRRADAGGALQTHDGAGWLPVLGRDTGWVTIYELGGTATVRARTLDRTLWVRATVNAVSSGWTCPNVLPSDMRPAWASSYTYALITEGSGTNSIAKMGVRADGALWFRCYGSAVNIDGIASVPL